MEKIKSISSTDNILLRTKSKLFEKLKHEFLDYFEFTKPKKMKLRKKIKNLTSQTNQNYSNNNPD